MSKQAVEIVSCPSCGNTLVKSEKCVYCDYDPKNNAGTGKSRLSDAELVKSINVYSKRGKRLLISSVPFALIGIFLLIMTGGEFSLIVIPALVLFAAFFTLFGMGIVSFGKANAMFKVNVVNDVLAEIIGGCVYKPKESIGRERIEAASLIMGWNKFHGDDYVSGTYRGRVIEFSDILLENEGTNSKGETETDTIFAGHWITCKLAKNLPAAVRLSEGGGKGNAETENMAFNNKYGILADDPHTMFYVLTPHFMEYIISADEAADARTFFLFRGDTVHIAIDTRRSAFEIDSDDKNNPAMARERIKNQMKYITNILDELLQNDYLFGEE